MPKRLVKSERNKVCYGVAGGLSEYLNIDPVLVRVVFIGVTFCTGG
ncbi:MAG: PspC domain-containing protein, partial [Acidobacteria bacterium]|nr:PspC domain-containing protein [Acidobacteriota bacterium]